MDKPLYINKLLKEYRIRARYSQYTLAQRLGDNITVIAAYESGELLPTKDFILRIAEVLRLSDIEVERLLVALRLESVHKELTTDREFDDIIVLARIIEEIKFKIEEIRQAKPEDNNPDLADSSNKDRIIFITLFISPFIILCLSFFIPYAAIILFICFLIISCIYIVYREVYKFKITQKRFIYSLEDEIKILQKRIDAINKLNYIYDSNCDHLNDLLIHDTEYLRELEIQEAQFGIHLKTPERIELRKRRQRVIELQDDIKQNCTHQ